MPIPVTCAGCGKRFSAPDRGAGKKVPCPKCNHTIVIPAVLRVADDGDYHLVDESPEAPPPARPTQPRAASPAAPARPAAPVEAPAARTAPAARPAPAAPLPNARPAWVPPTKSSTPTWLRHLHWCLAIAMLPLAVSIFLPDESPAELADRVTRSLEEVSAEDAPADGAAATGDNSVPAPAPQSPSGSISSGPQDESDPSALLDEITLDDLLALFPGKKLEGALLARDSYLHWLFALVSVAAYLTFFVFLASDQSAKPLHLLGLGGFTATFGILLLVIVQALSTVGYIGGRGIVALILLVLFLIGLSYSAALDPDTGFFVSFLGFTCGVGLCEELCKALPILIYYRIGNKQNWRGAFLWGLASGTGFGVSEGIMYSQDFYNGIAGPGVYVVRFVSCVALHAVWSGSVGIAINQRQDLLQNEEEEWWMYLVHALRLIAIPMVLHGLYDTLLKKDMEFLALLVAVASFGYLAWLISRLRTSDDEDERATYVARYIRSKAATQRGS